MNLIQYLDIVQNKDEHTCLLGDAIQEQSMSFHEAER